MIMLDTNAILRFLLQDNQKMADSAEEQMLSKKYLVPIEVVAEVVYVLDKVYKTDRATIHFLIRTVLLNKNSVIPHHSVVEEAIDVYGKTKFDFVDCLMVGYAKHKGYEIFTFDKKLKKYLAANLDM